MENEVIKLLFEDEVYMDVVSKILDEDKAFLYSLLKLAGYKQRPKNCSIKLGLIKKEEEK